MEDSESLRQSPEKLSSAVSGLAEGTVNAAVAAISAVFPQVGILLTFGLATAQGRQAEQFSRFVQKSFANIEQSKLDGNYLRSQEFLELLLAASHEVDRTLSEQNHRALANALANSSLLGESLKPGNRAILRCLGQMSADEILALSVIAQESENPTFDENIGFLGVKNDTVASKLRWSVADAQIVCDSLAQLNLVLDGMHDRLSAHEIERKYWRLTPLGKRVIGLAADQ